MTHDTNDSWNLKRIADALEQIAANYVPYVPSYQIGPATMTVDSHRFAKENADILILPDNVRFTPSAVHPKQYVLAEKLQAWLYSEDNPNTLWLILRDLVNQSTKAETIELIAALAKEHGFNRDE